MFHEGQGGKRDRDLAREQAKARVGNEKKGTGKELCHLAMPSKPIGITQPGNHSLFGTECLGTSEGGRPSLQGLLEVTCKQADFLPDSIFFTPKQLLATARKGCWPPIGEGERKRRYG